MSLYCRAPSADELVRMKCSIDVCSAHRSKVRAYVLSDANKEMIRTKLMEDGGHAEPDFLSAILEFVPIAQPRLTVLHDAAGIRCDREGCLHQASWQIALKFKMMWQRKESDKPLVAVLTNLCVCDEHRLATTVSDVFDGEGRSKTLGWLNSHGVSMPEMDAEIEFVPMIDGRGLT